MVLYAEPSQEETYDSQSLHLSRYGRGKWGST